MSSVAFPQSQTPALLYHEVPAFVPTVAAVYASDQ